MRYYIRKYPLSLLIVVAIIYLSFFKPPKTELDEVPDIDKMVHFCMYLGLSGMIWLEFFKAHKGFKSLPIKRAIIGSSLFPLLFGGCIELAQKYLTTYRSGEWLDFFTDFLGVFFASLIAYYLVRPWLLKRKDNNE
ncbi:MAG: hypothetical protein WCR45_00100 [Bacteroidaceae bacterium]|nr:hypothetical protein [Bacteroidaceae bacterium]